MKLIILTLVLASFAMADKNKWDCEHKDQVSTLTKDNFDEFIAKHRHVFVKFYAPWCGHCKSMAPSYAKLAAKMNEKEGGIPIADVDATESPELAERFGVEGYPTLKFFVDGKPVDYQGEREGDAIENFINKKLSPASKQLNKVEEIKELESSKLAVVLVTSEDSAEQVDLFNTFSSAYDIGFYYASFEGALEATEATGKYNLIVYRNFDDGKKVLASADLLTVEEMKTFFEAVKSPTVLDFDQEAAEKIFGGEETACFLFSNDAANEYVTKFNEVAKERKGAITFAKSTIKEGLGERLSEYLGITEADNNSIRIVKFESGNVVKYSLHNWDKEQLVKFIDDFKAGVLSPYFKSDPIPESNSEPVKVIVGNNFEDLIINSDKWVLLEVYAPWCGHCKKLTPIYDELAKKLLAHDDILIAKMDGTTNEHASVSVKGFPTLKWFKKGDKANPIDFEGDRTLEGFLTYLEKETGKKLVAPENQDEQLVDESL